MYFICIMTFKCLESLVRGTLIMKSLSKTKVVDILLSQVAYHILSTFFPGQKLWRPLISVSKPNIL